MSVVIFQMTARGDITHMNITRTSCHSLSVPTYIWIRAHLLLITLIRPPLVAHSRIYPDLNTMNSIDNIVETFDNMKKVPYADLAAALPAAKDLLNDPETSATFTPAEVKDMRIYMICLQAVMFGYSDGVDGKPLASTEVWQPD